jgi:hypothetical protein
MVRNDRKCRASVPGSKSTDKLSKGYEVRGFLKPSAEREEATACCQAVASLSFQSFD